MRILLACLLACLHKQTRPTFLAKIDGRTGGQAVTSVRVRVPSSQRYYNARGCDAMRCECDPYTKV